MFPTTIRRSAHALLAAAALFATVGAVGAQPPAPPEAAELAGTPHAMVSSDGRLPEPSAEGALSARFAGLSPAARGDGRRVAAEQARVTDEPIAPVRVPGQEAAPESVISPDGRVQVTTTTSFPYRAIAHITSSIGGCTGWLIGPNTVATAGHCIYSTSSNAWATNVKVYPGRNGSSTPYGSCSATRLFSVTGWTVDENRDYDYGAIKLNCSVGNNTGYFGFRWTSASLTGQSETLSGYPGDKAYGTQWRHADQVRLSQTRRLYYSNDTAGGQSGAPVYNGTSTCNPCGIAIHAYGVDSTGYNGGTRITEAVFNNLLNWKNAPQ